MGRKRCQPEKDDNSEGAAVADLAPVESIKSPMDRFKSLARRLTKVSREDLTEQERRHEAENPLCLILTNI
jgi:hypothetical protein